MASAEGRAERAARAMHAMRAAYAVRTARAVHAVHAVGFAARVAVGAAVVLGVLSAPAGAQQPCDVLVDAAQPSARAALDAFHSGLTDAGSDPVSADAPLAILVPADNADLAAALCAPDVRRLLAGRVLCIAVPAEGPDASPVGGAAMLAVRGGHPVSVYWEGNVLQWVAPVIAGEVTELELPEISGGPGAGIPGAYFAKGAGMLLGAALNPQGFDAGLEQVKEVAQTWGRYRTIVSLLSASGDHERALAAARHAWDVSRGSLVLAGVRWSFLLSTWRELLEADPAATRAALQAELERALADQNAQPADSILFRDVLSLCMLLDAPDDFARQVRRHVEFNASTKYVFSLSRDEGFDFLCGAGCFDAARLLLDAGPAESLRTRLEDSTARPADAVAAEARARELVTRFLRVARIGGDEEANAVVVQAQALLGARGLRMAVEASMDEGPPDDYSRRWGRKLLGESSSVLSRAERERVERWLGG
jgi:hypothetical protein